MERSREQREPYERTTEHQYRLQETAHGKKQRAEARESYERTTESQCQLLGTEMELGEWAKTLLEHVSELQMCVDQVGARTWSGETKHCLTSTCTFEHEESRAMLRSVL